MAPGDGKEDDDKDEEGDVDGGPQTKAKSKTVLGVALANLDSDIATATGRLKACPKDKIP